MTTKEIRQLAGDRIQNIEPLSNGTYMAIERHEDEKRPDRINVVLNWHTELTRR